MIIVTGGAGMIGSNIIKALNDTGYRDILAVDNLKDGTKFANLVDLDIADYIDKEDFIANIVAGDDLGEIDAVFHEGACSSTTEWDGKYMMDNNYQYSKDLLHYCLDREIPFLYASSAATYGGREEFIEERQFEEPLNVYGYSKFLFDQYVREILPEADSQICGFRYFNVYGPREGHKGGMASVAFHLNSQINRGENHLRRRRSGSEPVVLEKRRLRHLQLRHRPCGNLPGGGRRGSRLPSERRSGKHPVPGKTQRSLSGVYPGRPDQAARRRL